MVSPFAFDFEQFRLANTRAVVHEDVGRAQFIGMYVAGGVVGTLVSLWAHVLQGAFLSSSMGASGAIYAISAAWAYLAIA